MLVSPIAIASTIIAFDHHHYLSHTCVRSRACVHMRVRDDSDDGLMRVARAHNRTRACLRARARRIAVDGDG